MVLPRKPAPTVTFVDEYCLAYQDLFPEVRSFKSFKHLHLGMISDIKRKTLPAIAKVVGLNNEQALHHFLTESPWNVIDLRNRRLSLVLKMLKGESFPLIIDETGDKKKGDTTDYVARQYIGNLGKVENGIVSVNAYGVKGGIVFPLIFKVFKPLSTLKPEEPYKTKPQLAVEIISELRDMGLEFDMVLADSLSGESSTFIEGLNKLELKYVVAIRSNHKAWLNQEQACTYGEWQTFDRVFSNGKEQTRYIQEIICLGDKNVRYWKLTSDILLERKNSTWYLMTNLLGELHSCLGNHYGFRNWIEYGIKQAKNELGWADFRVTDYQQIEKWWEVVSCAFLLVSFHAYSREINPRQSSSEEKSNSTYNQKINPQESTTQAQFNSTYNQEINPQKLSSQEKLNTLNSAFVPPGSQSSSEPSKYSDHEWWDFSISWKSTLNNLRLIIQPYVFFNFISPWLKVFDIPALKEGFLELINYLNLFHGYVTFDSG